MRNRFRQDGFKLNKVACWAHLQRRLVAFCRSLCLASGSAEHGSGISPGSPLPAVLHCGDAGIPRVRLLAGLPILNARLRRWRGLRAPPAEPHRQDKPPDHLESYLAHSLPVLVVLYDPRNGEAWWQHVSKENIRRTDKGWALFVPRDQRLGEQAGAPLEAIAQLVTAEERVRIEPVKPLRPGVANFAPIYDVLHSVTRAI